VSAFPGAPASQRAPAAGGGAAAAGVVGEGEPCRPLTPLLVHHPHGLHAFAGGALLRRGPGVPVVVRVGTHVLLLVLLLVMVLVLVRLLVVMLLLLVLLLALLLDSALLRQTLPAS